jgi:hypothetical protein
LKTGVANSKETESKKKEDEEYQEMKDMDLDTAKIYYLKGYIKALLSK